MGFRKPFQERAAEPQVPPLRSAPVGMTGGGAVLPGTVVAEREPVFITLGGPKAETPADNSAAGATTVPLHLSGLYRIVIPTGAQRSGATCGFSSGKEAVIVLYKTYFGQV
jgi:hypothetical protein